MHIRRQIKLRMSLQKPPALYQIGNEIDKGPPNIRMFAIPLPRGVNRTVFETKTYLCGQLRIFGIRSIFQ
jgi:hypothetical protein